MYVSIFGTTVTSSDGRYMIETDRRAYPVNASDFGPHAAAEVSRVEMPETKRRVYVPIQPDQTQVRVDEFVTAYLAPEDEPT